MIKGFVKNLSTDSDEVFWTFEPNVNQGEARANWNTLWWWNTAGIKNWIELIGRPDRPIYLLRSDATDTTIEF